MIMWFGLDLLKSLFFSDSTIFGKSPFARICCFIFFKHLFQANPSHVSSCYTHEQTVGATVCLSGGRVG